MYRVEESESLSIVSRRVYGNENQVDLLKSANPGLDDKLSPNATLITPIDPNSPINRNRLILPNNEDEVSMLINGKIFKYFLGLLIIKSMDKIDSIEFDAPMESDNFDFRKTFKPFSFASVQIYIGNELLFNGTMLDITPNVSTKEKTVSITAYSRCGVLNDCTPSSNQFEALEFNNAKLSQIANSLIKPFGLKAIFNDDEGASFERVAIEPDGNILSFLTDLANKRELIISSSKYGNLVFQKAIEFGVSVASLKQNISPVSAIKANFNSQKCYSHISGIEPIEVGLDGSKYTVKNEKVQDSFRPFNYKVKDTETSDVKKAVSMKMGKMYGEMVNYEVALIGWRDEAGYLFEPNTFINLESSDNMIFSDYQFLIKSVVLQLGIDNKATKLNLVLPESYSGNIPRSLPWEEE